MPPSKGDNSKKSYLRVQVSTNQNLNKHGAREGGASRKQQDSRVLITAGDDSCRSPYLFLRVFAELSVLVNLALARIKSEQNPDVTEISE